MGRHSKPNIDNQSLLLAKEVRWLCAPLFRKHNINSFSYSKVFLDGSRAELWSDADALHHSFINKKYIANTYTPDNYKDEDRYVYLPNKIESHPQPIKMEYMSQLIDQKEIFDHDHCFLIVNKCKDFCEYSIFYTPSTFTSAINFYMNHLETLDQFSEEFKDKSQHLIKAVEKDRIIRPWRIEKIMINPLSLELSNQMYKQRPIYLTRREKQVIQHLIEGKSAKESAILLGISPRTVESYLADVKEKFHCNKSSDLIIKFLDQNPNMRLFDTNAKK